MSDSINKVMLIGNLGGDPEVLSLQRGGRVANLRLATSEYWKGRSSDERRERTEWHNVAIFSENLIAATERLLRKGSKVYVEGQLRTRKSQDRHGDDHFTTEVVLEGPKAVLIVLDGTPDDRRHAREHLTDVSNDRGLLSSPHHQDFADDIDDDNIPF